MARSVKVNFLLNLTNTVTGILFPMITFPYASRILMAEGIGQVNFFQSIISYFTLFACLGIPLYAIRKVAKIKDDPAQLSHVTTEILILNAVLTFVVYAVAIVVGMCVDKISVNMPLFLLMSLSIVLTSMGCEWFYQGREDFKYITIRGIIVKTIAAALMFLLVKDSNDVLWYGLYTVVGSVGGNVFNIIRLRKFVHRRHIRRNELRPFSHLRPAIKIFVISALTTIYLELNTIMLGFLDDTQTVGYYVGATKIIRIAITIVAALGLAMLPRMSQYIKEGNNEKFAKMVQKGYEFVVTFTLPITFGLIAIAPVLIPIFCGDSYGPSVETVMFAAPAVIAVGVANVLTIQILYPQEKENLILRASIAGVVVSLALNILLIPFMRQDGAAICLVATESAVTLSLLFWGRKFIPIKFLSRRNFGRLICAAVMGASVYGVMHLTDNNAIALLSGLATGGVVYGGLLLLFRDPIAKEIVNFALRRKTKSE